MIMLYSLCMNTSKPDQKEGPLDVDYEYLTYPNAWTWAFKWFNVNWLILILLYPYQGSEITEMKNKFPDKQQGCWRDDGG